MRIRILFVATPLLLAAAAYGQVKSPDFSAPHDSRTELPAVVHAPKPSVEPEKLLQQTLVVARVRLDASQASILRNRTCYAIRGYEYSADPDGTGRVSPQGTSTCQSAAKTHLKSAAGQ